MLDIILVAAAMYVCPGDVYTDVPRPGCTPLQESGKEGFSTIPEAPEFKSKMSVPSSEAGAGMRNGQSKLPAASAEECAMYDEWVKLSTKSSGIGARDLSTSEFERWTNVKQVFGNSPPPNCR
ncbi:MAG TPA: hypothetical protein VFM24_02540 [Nitrospira sp.]|nr:hypothetical protein [Nitrospira sp.]